MEQDRPGGLPRAKPSTTWTRPGRCCRASACPASCGPASPWEAAARPSPTTATKFDELVRRGLELSPVTEVLIEESIIGWKEYEMEVMRDADDNVVIICSIENFDPMGVHTGDSITVAPAQTLTDKEYQRMRDASLAVIREIGVETGGSNIQFAIDPQDGPHDRDRNESAASAAPAPWPRKATGFPDRQDRGQAGRRLSACTSCPTISPARRWPASSRRSITW